MVGVNPDRRESNLEVIPDDVLALWRGNSGNGATQAGGRRCERGTEAALQFVVVHYASSIRRGLAESLLAGRYLGAQQQEDS